MNPAGLTHSKSSITCALRKLYLGAITLKVGFSVHTAIASTLHDRKYCSHFLPAVQNTERLRTLSSAYLPRDSWETPRNRRTHPSEKRSLTTTARLKKKRPRADEGHVAAKNVEKLRQLIEPRPP
jgi:hypothetical protein